MNIYLRYQTMANQLTAYGLDTGAQWPYVQLPSFVAQASAAERDTSALFISFSPIVQPDELEQYEDFVRTNRDWIRQGLEYHRVADTNVSALAIAPRVFPLFNQSFDKAMVLPFHLPVGQISSVHEKYSQLNADIGTDSSVDVAFAILNQTREAVMSGIRLFTIPSSFLATPVFASFEDDAPIVAVSSGYLRWNRNFENLLPIHSEPLILVIRNCDDALSYEIRGPDVEYLGLGDNFHDPKYNYLERNGTFAPYTSSTGCDFTLHIYPTSEFEATYRTNIPTTMTIATVGCFVFTAILFVLFNLVVEYRQKRLESNATTNSALVSSLFPENVRERLVEEYNRGSSLALRNMGDFDPCRPGHCPVATRPPIADRFESCSVLFADLVGCEYAFCFRVQFVLTSPH